MLGALIGAAASLGSSLLGNKANDKARAQEAAQQREFAQNGIQWKVEDARKAGVHPLYALGANTVSYAPQSVGGSDFSGLASAGQDIGRAIDSTRSNGARSEALATTIAKLQAEGLGIDNDIKRTELASKLATVRGQSGPAMPGAATTNLWGLDGVGDLTVDGPGLKLQTRRDVSDPESPSNIPGSGPSVAFNRNNYGGWDPTIPPELAESYEQDKVGYLKWLATNRLLPNFSDPQFPPRIPHKWNEKVVWDHKWQDWRVKSWKPRHKYAR